MPIFIGKWQEFKIGKLFTKLDTKSTRKHTLKSDLATTPIDYFGGKESFARQQKHDRMKRAWAKQNGYLLIEIRYNQNIKDIMLPLISLLTGDMTVGNDN